MITTLSGANTFGWQHDLQQRVTAFVAEHDDLAVERIDGESAELPRITEALTSLPFLSSKKLVVLRAPSANKQFVERVETILESVPDTSDVIIVEPKLDKRSAYCKLLKKATALTEYNELDSNGLAAWLQRLAKDQGGAISSNDARYLVERIGANQQILFNEIKKLLIYAPTVTRASIDMLTEQTPQSTIFQLLEAAFAGNAKRALELYQEQRALKVEAPQIIAMLAWQLHILAVVKAAGQRSPADIAKEAKLSPYVVQKSAVIARYLSLLQVKRLILDLLDIDLKSKRTNLDIAEALQNYLLRLSLSEN